MHLTEHFLPAELEKKDHRPADLSLPPAASDTAVILKARGMKGCGAACLPDLFSQGLICQQERILDLLGEKSGK